MKATLPGAPKNESNQRGHWGAKAARTSKWRKAAALVVKGLLAKSPLDAALLVTLTRVGPRELDFDGLTSALKATRDGVADALRVDDATPLVRWEYRQRIGTPAVEVELARCPPRNVVVWRSPEELEQLRRDAQAAEGA